MFISRGRSLKIKSTRDLPVAEALREALDIGDARVSLYAADGSRIYVEVSSEGRAGCVAETPKGVVEGPECLHLFWEAGEKGGVVEVIQLTPEQTKLDLDSRPDSLLPRGVEDLAPARPRQQQEAMTATIAATEATTTSPAQPIPLQAAPTEATARPRVTQPTAIPAPSEPPARLASKSLRKIMDLVSREAKALLGIVRGQTDKLDTLEEITSAFRPIIERTEEVLRKLEREARILGDAIDVFEEYMQPKDYTTAYRAARSLLEQITELREAVELAKKIMDALAKYADIVPVDMDSLGRIEKNHGPEVAEIFARSSTIKKLVQNSAKTIKKRIEKPLKTITGMEKQLAKTQKLIEQTISQYRDELLKPPAPQEPEKPAQTMPATAQTMPAAQAAAPTTAITQVAPTPAPRHVEETRPQVLELLTKHGLKIGEVFDFATASVTLIAGKEAKAEAEKSCIEALLDLAPLKKTILIDCRAGEKRLLARIDPEKSIVEAVLEDDNGRVVFGEEALKQAAKLEATKLKVYVQ